MKILHSQFAGMDAQSPVASEVVAEKEIGGAWGGGGGSAFIVDPAFGWSGLPFEMRVRKTSGC